MAGGQTTATVFAAALTVLQGDETEFPHFQFSDVYLWGLKIKASDCGLALLEDLVDAPSLE